jgi:hypothetical protein
MPIDKLQPQFLNLDDDERLISKVEMSDAQNVRTSVDAAGNALVLRNALGNFSRSEDANIQNGSMPAGTNICVGTCSSERLGYIYWFVWNSNDDHTILRYDNTTKKAYIVYQDDLLLFNSGTRVTADVIENNNDDVLLYFTDGVNSPKKINATIAEQSFSGTGGYPTAFSTGTVDVRSLYVTAAKAPPLTPPVITFVNNPDVGQTDIFEKNFQFAYQYVYRDGEESALSPYTQLGVSISQLKDGFINNGQRNFFNQINLELESSQGDVVRIKVYARKGDLTTSTFYLIDEIDNNFNGQAGTQSISFSDDQAFIPLSTQVQDKVYDNVPQLADSQAIANGRLFYGGYTDGYPNVNLDQSKVVPNYNIKSPIFNVAVTKIASSGGALSASKSNRFQLDFSGLPSSITEDSKVLVNFIFDWGKMRLTNELGDPDNYRWVNRFAVNIDEISGLRWQSTNQANPVVGAFSTGYLNGPPSIKFTSRKGTNDAEENTIPLARVRKGIKVISSGVQVEEIIDINLPANNAPVSRVDAINTVINAITKNYPFFVQPQDGEGGFSTVTTSGNSASTEKIAFRGQGFARVSQTGSTSNETIRQMRVSIEKLTLQVDKMIQGVKPCEVINPDADMSRFDFIEGTNSEQVNNRILGIQGNGSSKTISNGRGDFPDLNDQGDTRDGVVNCDGASITSGSNFLIGNTDANGSKCFKSGSKHQLGIILYDNRGRPGGVQKLPTVEIDHTNNRSTENSLDGFADVVMRINATAPDWASYYAPVYVGQGSIINKVQYGIGGAYLATNYDGLQGGFGANSQIFLSLRTLQGKSNSYKEAYGALTEYKYSQGDRLRIVRYSNDLKATFEFNVTGIESFDSDVNKNPILDRSSSFALNNTTGDFLSIEPNESAVGFRPEDILEGTAFWDDNCIIEIFRENNAFETDVYFELGRVLPISAGAYGTARTSTTPAVLVSSDGGSGLLYHTNTKVFKGDELKLTSDNSKTLSVGNVTRSTLDSYSAYTYQFFVTANTNIVADANTQAFTVSNPEAVIQLDQGDSYYRLRTLYVAPAAQNSDVASNAVSAYTQNSIVDFIEDPSVSDFFVSNFTSKGRPFAYQPEARTIKRRGSVTYSDPFIVDTRVLGLSSFNLSLQNFFDYNYEYGSIKSLVSFDEIMYIIQERRAGIIPVSRNIVEFGDGKSEITASKNIVGPIQYYSGDYGCNNNPESVAVWRDQVFFADVKSGKVLMISQKSGITVLSDLNVDSFFKNNFFSLEESATNRQIIAGVDYDNREFLISADSVNTVVITISDNVTGTPVTGTGAGRVTNGKIMTDSIFSDTSTYSWDSDPREYQKNQDKYQDSGAGLLIIDTLTSLQSIFLATEFAPTQIRTASTDTVIALNTAIPIVMTTSAQAAFSYGTYNQATEEITLDNSTYSSTTTLGAEVETLGDFTIGYDCYQPRWNNKYTFRPERVQSLSDQLYTFKSGKIYEHAEFFGTTAVPRCTYYGKFTGTTYSGGARGDAIIETVSNFNPSMIKAYEALSLEGNDRWSCTLSNSTQNATIPTTGVASTEVWEEKEGFYYAPVPRNSSVVATGDLSSVDGTSQVFSIGTIASSSTGTTLTFKNHINNSPFPVGTTTALYKVNGSNLSPLNTFATAIATDKTLTLNASATVATDDIIVALANAAIEGDVIRDYYMKIRLANSSINVVELYAINAVYSKSPLANQLGQ